MKSMKISREALKIMIYNLVEKSREVGYQNALANIKTYDEHGNESYDEDAIEKYNEMRYNQLLIEKELIKTIDEEWTK